MSPHLAKLRTQTTEQGFTLVEIAVSIAILGVALTILIVLHTSYLNIFLRERNTTEAALLAKLIMTDIEVSAEPPEEGSSNGDLFDKLNEIGKIDADDHAFQEKIKGWRYEIAVESYDAPEYELEDILRHVDVTVAWGEAEGESFTLVYYARSK